MAPTRERRPGGDRSGVQDLQRARHLITGDPTRTVNIDPLLVEIIAVATAGHNGARELSDVAARLAYLVAELELLNLAGAFEPWAVAA